MLSVSIAGVDGTAEVEVTKGDTPAHILTKAARQLETTVDGGRLSATVDGETVSMDDLVPADATKVAFAPAVNNG